MDQAEKTESMEAGAHSYRETTQAVKDASMGYVKNTEQLNEKIKELQKELADVKKNCPLPVACHPDPDLLRVLAEAVHTANRAASGQ